MHYVADLHLHSRFSRAVSQNMTVPTMARYAKTKGIDILTASDFTHPVWFKEIKSQLEEVHPGIYRLKDPSSSPSPLGEGNQGKKPYFLLSTEISSICKDKDKLRRIHNLVFSPNLETAEKINEALLKRGCNLTADGRPIIGLRSKELLELILEIDERSYLIPCHIWTPHFGIYGSASGYDSLEEAFGDYAKYIYGIETGLSSDPEMNWAVAELKDRSILSFSDAHSPAKMGREATVFDLEGLSFQTLKEAIMRKGRNKIVYTIEFYPEEGKYHFSGHRNCKVVRDPKELLDLGNKCPVCGRQLTEGVLYRVQQLAEEYPTTLLEEKYNTSGLKWYTDTTHHHPPYVKLVPLLEIVAESQRSTVFSQKTVGLYDTIINAFGSELEILLKADISEIAKIGGDKIADGIKRVRHGDIAIDAGYDGEYGKVEIWSKEPESQEKQVEQSGLF